MDAKATLGLGGVAVVLGAVMAAMGFFSYLRVPSSLVVLQVVPFLVLAVGADNIFIFVLEYQVGAHARPPVWHRRHPTPCPAVRHSLPQNTVLCDHSLSHKCTCPTGAPALALRQTHARGEGVTQHVGAPLARCRVGFQ